MGKLIYLSFEGLKISRTGPMGILVNDSPMTAVLPADCSQTITYAGPNVISRVLLPEELTEDVRAAAASVGMVEV